MSHEHAAEPNEYASGTAGWPVLPGYEVLSAIAAGGMATVYLARPTVDRSRLVAIKHCHPHLQHDAAFVSMFLDEARLASLIRHPNVVATLDIGNADSLYFVMQYVEGVSLADWVGQLATDGKYAEASSLLRICVDVLAGLGAAHALCDPLGRALRLVHRDVSPQNILVGLDGVAKLSDFGIAKAEARSTRTRTGQVKGKSGYMSPEQILLEPVDHRSDLYALGVVLWEALTGRRLFDGDSEAATINLVLSGKIAPPSSVAGTDPRLDPIVAKALSFDPSARFASAEAMAQAIAECGVPIAPREDVGRQLEILFGEKVAARRAKTRLDRSRAEAGAPRSERFRRARRVLVLAAAALFSLLALIVLESRRHAQPKGPEVRATSTPLRDTEGITHARPLAVDSAESASALRTPEEAAPRTHAARPGQEDATSPSTSPGVIVAAPPVHSAATRVSQQERPLVVRNGRATPSRTSLVKASTPTVSPQPEVGHARNRPQPSEYRPIDL